MYGLDREEYRNWIGTADGSCTDSGDGSHILCDGGVSVGWTGRAVDPVYPGAGGWLCDCHTVSKGGWCKTSVRNL